MAKNLKEHQTTPLTLRCFGRRYLFRMTILFRFLIIGVVLFSLLFLFYLGNSWSKIPQNSRKIYATLITSEDYVIGVKVLGKSLQLSNATHPFVVMITDSISEKTIEELHEMGFLTKKVILKKKMVYLVTNYATLEIG